MRLAILSIVFLSVVSHDSDLKAQWLETNGPNGGEISCFAAIGTELFAGTYDGGIFRSSDSGMSWSVSTAGITDIECMTTIGGNLVVASGADNAFGDGVYYSTDTGKSWNNTQGISSFSLDPVVAMAAMGSSIYATNTGDAGEVGSFLSTDSGKTWSQWTNPPAQVNALLVSNGKLLAATISGLFISSDTGRTWSDTANAFADTSVLALSEVDSTLFLISGNHAWTFKGIYSSTDGGSTWSPTAAPIPRGIPIALSVVNRNLSVPVLLVGSTLGVFLSIDHGATWIDAGLDSNLLYSAAIDGPNLLGGTSNGVFLSSDFGSSWVMIGVGNTTVSALASDGSTLFAGTGYPASAAIFRSTDRGSNWELLPASDPIGGSRIDAIETNGSVILSSAYGSSIFRSVDSGTNWMINVNGLNDLELFSFAKSGSTIFAGSNFDEIVSTTDSGLNWTVCDSVIAKPESLDDNLNAEIDAIAANGNTIVAASNNMGILTSFDGGKTWQTSDNFPDTNVRALAWNGSTLFADGVPDGLFYSTDVGSTWIPADSGLEHVICYRFAISGTKMFAATDSGIFSSSDAGKHWHSINDNMPVFSIDDLTISDSSLFVATTGAGVWRRALSDFDVSSVAPPQTLANESLAAYPNPLVSSTMLELTTIESSDAVITIVNPLGAEIARIYSGTLDAGDHTFAWNAGTYPSGIYECVVQMNGKVYTLPLSHF